MPATTPSLLVSADVEEALVIVQINTADTEHIVEIECEEAYALATYVEWLLDESDRDEPSNLDYLPDHIAVELGMEPCLSCANGHENPVLFVAASYGDDLSEVSVVELRHPLDLEMLPALLIKSAVKASF